MFSNMETYFTNSARSGLHFRVRIWGKLKICVKTFRSPMFEYRIEDLSERLWGRGQAFNF